MVMGMLGVMRSMIEAPDDVKLRSQCVWCRSREYSTAYNMRLYTTMNDFGINLIFCSDDHSERFIKHYDLICVYDVIHAFCRRSTESEGYTMRDTENIFNIRRVKMDVDIDGTLREFMVNCRKKENVQEEEISRD